MSRSRLLTLTQLPPKMESTLKKKNRSPKFSKTWETSSLKVIGKHAHFNFGANFYFAYHS